MGYRNITVDGVDYRWTPRSNMGVAVRDPNGKTHLLEVDLEVIEDTPVITPRHVAKAIRDKIIPDRRPAKR